MIQYRLLNEGEIIKIGDEFYSGETDDWEFVRMCAGETMNKCHRPRRRLIVNDRIEKTCTFTVKSSEKDILQKGLDLLKMITDDQKKINQIENIQLTLDNEG